MRVRTSHTERTSAIAIKVAAFDRLVVRVGHAIVPLGESLARYRVSWVSQLVGPMGEATLIAEVTRAGRLEELTDRCLELAIHGKLLHCAFVQFSTIGAYALYIGLTRQAYGYLNTYSYLL